jgi:N-formylglutamate amidohydrolase
MPHRPSTYVEIAPSAGPSAAVISSPHSGAHYPAELLDEIALGRETLRALEDGPTHLLVQGCAADGAVVLAATRARAFVDLNRGPREIDPELLAPGEEAGELEPSAKVLAGLGVVPSRVGTRQIYARPLGAAGIRARLDAAWHPYHHRLEQLLRARERQFGAVLLLDCHSMPAEAAGGARPAIDISLGDRYGTSCDGRLVELAESLLEGHGFRTARNRPYAGGFITEHHGRPHRGRHALQLEIRRDLFMNPRTLEPRPALAEVAAAVRAMSAALAGCVAGLVPTSSVPAREAAVPGAPEPGLLRAAD